MTKARLRAGTLVGALAAISLAGCLGEPEIEDRWTRLDIISTNLVAGRQVSPGESIPVNVRAAVTYRSIITGFYVVELRASSTYDAGDVEIDPDAPRLEMAQQIDSLLANSVTAGRATRAVTGWDHLIQEIDFSFTGSVPAMAGSTGTSGLFFVTYLADGEEIELEDGSDSLVVTPFGSSDYQILPMGLELEVMP